MRAPARFVTYGILGWGIEVCFTAVRDALTGTGGPALEGRSYVWMHPIYGAGGLAGEAVAGALRGRPWWVRGAAYAATFWTVEAASGELLRRSTGDVPWGPEYRSYPDSLGNGLVRASYAPYWAVAGLALERVSPVLRRLTARKAVA